MWVYHVFGLTYALLFLVVVVVVVAVVVVVVAVIAVVHYDSAADALETRCGETILSPNMSLQIHTVILVDVCCIYVYISASRNERQYTCTIRSKSSLYNCRAASV